MSRVVVLAVLLALFAGCASDPPFDEGTLDDLRQAFDDEGLTVCATSPGTTDLPGEVATNTFIVAVDCDSDDEAFVAVTEFEEASDRDAAARQLDVRQMHGAGEAWSFGPYTVVVSGPRDDDVAASVAEAVDDLGGR